MKMDLAEVAADLRPSPMKVAKKKKMQLNQDSRVKQVKLAVLDQLGPFHLLPWRAVLGHVREDMAQPLTWPLFFLHSILANARIYSPF